jgi:hypothetical protein
VYWTKFDYCPGHSISRSVGETVGIAGKFYTVHRANPDSFTAII